MKKNLVSVLVGSLFVPITSAMAVTIDYDGSDTSMLKNPPSWAGGGGLSLYPGTALAPEESGNTVNMTGGSIPAYVYGGLSNVGGVTNNTVNISGGSVNGVAYGGINYGYGVIGDVTNNTVNITGNSIVNAAIGGNALNGISDVSNNKVNISDNVTVTGSVYGGSSRNGNSTYNTVSITGGTIQTGVYGGLSQGAGNATNNTINMSGGTIHSDIYAGHSEDGDASYNMINVSGSSVIRTIYGGSSYSGNASHNTLIVTGGTVNSVFGGGNSTLAGDVTYNTVIIGEAASISGTVSGGSSNGGDQFTGNTLNVSGRHSFTNLLNFQFLNFTLPEDMLSGETLITSTGFVFLGGASTVQSINIAGSQSVLTVGDTVTLIDAGNPITGSIVNTTTSGTHGMSLSYQWDEITINGNTLTARLASISKSANPQTHALLQGRSAQSALLTQGADLAAGNGLQSMLQSARLGQQIFIAVQGGTNRYETGSHIDMDSFSFMLGGSWEPTVNLEAGATLGAFVEAGKGSYHSRNSFTNLASVKGSGHSDFVGAGLMGELSYASGLHTEGSLRIGRVRSNMDTDFYVNAEQGKYDTDSFYFGAHLGAGYMLALSQENSLDFYGRYSWNHIASDDVMVLGENYRFDASNSHRLRGGLRYARTMGNLMPYGGLAYEYELDGKGKGSVHGLPLKETDMSGGTAIGELGLSWMPKNNDRLRLDVALEGFAGKRDGVMGHVTLNYQF